MATSVGVNRRLWDSVRDEPQKMAQLISGYEKETVKSLEDACEPIKGLFDDKLAENITIAKMNSMQPADGLSRDESAAIHLYTMQWDVHENSLYMVLNRTLRSADRAKLQPWFRYLKLFLTAFFKLPSTKHTLVWHGVREDLSDLYPKNKVFAWWAFSSCTASIDVLDSPNYLGKFGPRTMLSIQTNSEKLIRAHSYFENEDEILLPPGIYLEVIGSSSPTEGLRIIQLEEIRPPHPMLAHPWTSAPEPVTREKDSKKTNVKAYSHVSSRREERPFTTSDSNSLFSYKKLDGSIYLPPDGQKAF